MQKNKIQCLSPNGLHTLRYVEWGERSNPNVLICVHGLTRCCRDFDVLATRLAKDFRVICPDIVGRGESDWLSNSALYALPQYCADIITLIARLDVETVSWLGTSMGGLIGMAIAADKNTPICRLVLNDIGPVLSITALTRIAQYAGESQRFSSLDEAQAYLRQVSAAFGKLTDEEWRHLTVHCMKRSSDQTYGFCYDPNIALPFRALLAQNPQQDFVDWSLYEAIRCPTLAIRGAESDLLSVETHAQMAVRGPRAQLITFPDVGHAPMFFAENQITAVQKFLLAS